jgi:hypothetical protein
MTSRATTPAPIAARIGARTQPLGPAVYAYISPILTDRAGLASGLVPIALAVWRLGMVARSVRHRRPHRRLATTPRDVRLLVAMAAFFALFTVTSAHPLTAFATAFLLGTGFALPDGAAGAADGRRRGRADARRLAQPLRVQRGQRAGSLARRDRAGRCWAPRRWRSGAHGSHRHGRELRHRRRPDQDDGGAGW